VSDDRAILVVNVGSSSVKLRLLDGRDALTTEREVPPGDEQALRETLAGFPDATIVGHRIVHGGTRYRAAVVVDDEVRAGLGELVALAPLHQPPALAALDIARTELPRARHVACFDTAFHSTLPDAASTYAVPTAWREQLGVRRYGFHGLSHAYAARRTADMLETPGADARIVSCHLGAGASLCAVAGGRSVDTTMGFTPLEGLVMATRSGTVDPGLILWLIREAGLEPAAIEDQLERHSGLLGLGGSADMRELIDLAARGSADAQLALDVYVHRLRGAIAAMAASLGGLDALVFTAGVGEHAGELRRRVTTGLAFLGVVVDPARNSAAVGEADAEISESDARVRSFVILAREDLEIAAQARRVL
jgi:acetate kinase